MRLLIDTRGIQFRVASLPEARKDKDGKQMTTPASDGNRPKWTLRLDALDDQRKIKETIYVEVAGDEPRLTFDGFALVSELVFAPWVGRDGKIRRSFRAASVVDAAQSGKSVQAVA